MENEALQAKTALLRARMAEIRRNEGAIRRTQVGTARLAAARDGVVRLTGRLDEARHQGRRAEQLVAQLAEAAAWAPKAPDPAPAQPPQPLASELVASHFAARREIADATAQVIAQERTTVRLFLETCGDRPVNTYTRGDITEFLHKLRRMPSVYGRSPADAELTMGQLIARADATDAKRLTDKTVKRHLSALAQFLQFAVDKGHLAMTAKADMVDGHAFRSGEAARDQRGAWTSDELRTLFGSPVWTGCRSRLARSEPGELIIRDARFWLPVLAAFQGGRLEEFADLYRRDLICDDGTWVLRLTPSVIDAEEEGGEQRKRRLKTANAKRTVALHPEILRLGFIDYAQRTAPDEGDPLFPDLRPQGPDGKRGPRITRWFVEYRRAIGIYRAGVAMHAFRHTANTRLRDLITDWQQERHVNYMMGHAIGVGQGGERYDKGPGLKKAAATLALLQYPEVDLSHLYTQES